MQAGRNSPKRPRMRPKYRAILALDLDCFYASVAIRARPHLADKPVVIVQKHLCVTSNYVARSRAKGAVQKLTPVSKALAACPELVLIDGSDLTPFREASLEVRGVIRAWLGERVKKVTERLKVSSFECPCQGLGFDEVFIDISRLVDAEIAAGGMPWNFCGHVFGVTQNDDVRRTLMVASHLAYALRTHICDTTKLTICAGIGDSKLLAKLSVNMNKPNDQTTFLPDNRREYVSGLHPRSLPGLGQGLLAKIQQYATECGHHYTLETVGDIIRIGGDDRKRIRMLSKVTGSETTAKHILGLLQAEDSSLVVDSGDAPKSISSEDSFRSCKTMGDLQHRITIEITNLARRLRQDGELYSRYPRTLTVSYRFRGQGYIGTTRSVQMPMEMISICCSREPGIEQKAINAVQEVVLLVLRTNANIGRSAAFDLNLFGVGASNFTDKGKSTNQNSSQTTSSFFTGYKIPKKESEDNATSRLSPVPRKRLLKARTTTIQEKLQVNQRREERSTGSTVGVRCPMCDSLLPTENAAMNSHIDQCLGVEPRGRVSKKRRTNAQTFSVDSFFKRA